jgi:fumarate reductase subunit D
MVGYFGSCGVVIIKLNKMKIHTEPFWWSLFGAGGAISALFLPILLIIWGIAIPLGWVDAPAYEHMQKLTGAIIAKLLLLAIISLSLFHWAHRFRFTLHEGLQLHRFSKIIAFICYGTAIIVTVITAYSLWTF